MKLEINLVPKTCFYKNVRQILTDKQWKIICSQVYSKYYYQCAICYDVGENHPVEGHEIWAYDDKNHIQILKDIIALCPMCHLTVHFGFAQIQGKGEKALFHLMKINSWTRNKADKHIKKSFDKWLQRSQNKYTLDISYLQEYGVNTENLVKNK